jgi:very-short-patch-repair endonuclease
MPRTSQYDRRTLNHLLERQHGVLSREQALACGMSPDVIGYRIRPDGPWRRAVPGVYITHTGPLTHDQQDMAALLYAGPRGILTGQAALRRYGFSFRPSDTTDVLVPATTQRHDAGFVRLHRTRLLPARVCVAGEIRYALVPRAVADAARGQEDLREVRTIVAESVQRGRCPLPLLVEELNSGPLRGSALMRQALAEVADGIRSSAEADLHDLIKRARLPLPMFNPRLFAGPTFIACPDCWWPEAGVAAEVDSRAWHLSPHDWERTMVRHAGMTSHGILVLHFSPDQVRKQRTEVVTVIRSALHAAKDRPLLNITAIPAT